MGLMRADRAAWGVGLSFPFTLSPHREASTVACRAPAPLQPLDPRWGASPFSQQAPQVHPLNPPRPAWEASALLPSGSSTLSHPPELKTQRGWSGLQEA